MSLSFEASQAASEMMTALKREMVQDLQRKLLPLCQGDKHTLLVMHQLLHEFLHMAPAALHEFLHMTPSALHSNTTPAKTSGEGIKKKATKAKANDYQHMVLQKENAWLGSSAHPSP